MPFCEKHTEYTEHTPAIAISCELWKAIDFVFLLIGGIVVCVLLGGAGYKISKQQEQIEALRTLASKANPAYGHTQDNTAPIVV